jgi:multidrug efflux pump
LASSAKAIKLIDIQVRQPVEERSHHLDPERHQHSDRLAASRSPSRRLARAHFVWEPGVVWREGREWAITVQSDVVDNIQGPTVSGQIDPLLKPLRAALPAGYTITCQGRGEADSGAAEASIAANVPLAMFLIFTLLMLQLHSFSRSLLVFLTGPLGVAGAAMALLIMGRPLGFVANLGIIALFGMIIRNSVILVDQIEQDIAAGHDPWTRSSNRRCGAAVRSSDGRRRRAGDDPVVALGILGADGGGHHGRAGGGDRR